MNGPCGVHKYESSPLQAVIQIAKKLGVRTVNVVRDREDIEQLKQRLTQ